MHWKVKIFTLLYQHAAIPTPLGLRQIRFPSEIPGLKICSVFTVASLPAALCPFCALAFECWLCAESSVSHFFLRFSEDRGAGLRSSGCSECHLVVSCPCCRASQNSAAVLPKSAGGQSAACQGARLRAGMLRSRKSISFHKTWFK